MTFDDLNALDFAALWRGLGAERQAAIGRAALQYAFGDLVAEGDAADPGGPSVGRACRRARHGRAGEPADWLFWTVPQVEARRRQRHPEQFPAGWRSPRSTTDPSGATRADLRIQETLCRD